MKKKLYLALLLLVMTVSFAWAVPARTTLFTIVQPDGDSLSLYLRGDEFNHYRITTDGHLLLENEAGYYCYATLSADGNTIPAKQVAHNEGERSKEERIFLASLNSDELFAARKKAMAPMLKARSNFSATAPLQIVQKTPTGSQRALILLVEFSDKAFTEDGTKETFNNMMNQSGFTYKNGANGSAKDYFMAQSGGTYTPIFDIIGPIKLPKTMEYYGGNDSYGNDLHPREMIREAVGLADQAPFNVDFSLYDNTGTNVVDMVYVIYAGNGEADSQIENTIWPHKWEIRGDGNDALVKDNKAINVYACSSELRYQLFAKPLAGIGTFCHEFSHTLGLADLYDTSGKDSFTLDNWSIMSSGNYLNKGNTPCNYSAFERSQIGWTIPITPSANTKITLKVGDTPLVVTSNNEYEYFLLENRQQEGWDAYLPQSGLMITHIDFVTKIWQLNTVNNNPTHRHVDLVMADNIWSKGTMKKDLFPIEDNNSFTDTSSPSSITWTGEPLNQPITDITMMNKVITFNFATPTGLSTVESINGVNTINGEVHIEALAGEQIQIYSISGQLIHQRVSTDETTCIPLPGKGVYIVRVNDKATKISY